MAETFKIHRWDAGETIAEVQAETFIEAIEKLVAEGKDLYRARLDGARLDFFKNDLWNVLLHAIPEIDGLMLAPREGRVEGSVYEGECSCLLGTIANIRHCDVNHLDNLQRDSSRAAEQWFMAISKGDTPEKSNVVKITLEWIAEFKRLLPVAST